MTDFVFIVDNCFEWHQENMKQNSSHYSSLRYGGPKLVSKVQEHLGAYVYYNTLIPIDDGVSFSCTALQFIFIDLIWLLNLALCSQDNMLPVFVCAIAQ